MRTTPLTASLTLAVSFTAAATGCGWRPLYASVNLATDAAAVFVHPVDGNGGRELTLELEELLNPSGRITGPPSYELSIRLRENITRAALRRDAVATRATMALTAELRLEPLGADEGAEEKAATSLQDKDEATDTPSFLAAATVRGSYDILADEYGALTSRRDMRRRLVRELAHRIAARVIAALSLRRKKTRP